MNSAEKLNYEYVADNTQTAQKIAAYLVARLGHVAGDVDCVGARVLHCNRIEGMQAERLRGYIDGLKDCLCGED